MKSNYTFFPSIGDLKIEKIIASFEIPLLCVYIDNKEDRYLALCVETEYDELTYLFTPVEVCTLLDLLQDNLSIANAMKYEKRHWIVKFSIPGFMVNSVDVIKNIEKLELPQNDVLLENHSKEMDAYISELQALNIFWDVSKNLLIWDKIFQFVILPQKGLSEDLNTDYRGTNWRRRTACYGCKTY